MKMLVPVDINSYSAVASRKAARLAINTWADVTILGMQPNASSGAKAPDEALSSAMLTYSKAFISTAGGVESPYGNGDLGPWHRIAGGVLEALVSRDSSRKSLRLVIREGNSLDAILEQARQDESDFIVIGTAAKKDDPEWIGEVNLTAKVANNAPCSVLVVKQEKTVDTVMGILDQEHVSQESLELINQMVTVHQAELKIVGLATAKGLDERVEMKMGEVLNYYAARNIKAWITMVTEEEIEGFAARAAETSLLGLWLGKKSFLAKIFSKDRVSQLINATTSSLLVLK
ncbi:MAG: universal stress protein [Nitrospiraceae bacterium]|nr:universal stress protein [Nitrospiraceae bacterium]